MNLNDINKIVKDIKKDLNNVKISKSETIDFEIFFAIGSEKSSKQFDLVVRNEHKEIVFVCNFYNGNIKDFLSAIPDNYNLNSDFPYDYFILFTNEFKFLDFKNLYRTSDIPFFSLEQFIKILKCKYSSLKKEIDLVLEEIKKQEKDIKEYLKICEKKIEKLEKELEVREQIITTQNYENNLYKNQIRFLENEFEKQIKKSLELKMKEVNFINKVAQLPIPEKINEYTEIKVGIRAEDKVKQIFSTTNAFFKDSFSILNNEVYLKREIYDYYSKGRIDLPENILSKTLIYKFDEENLAFISVNDDKNIFLSWVFFN